LSPAQARPQPDSRLSGAAPPPSGYVFRLIRLVGFSSPDEHLTIEYSFAALPGLILDFFDGVGHYFPVENAHHPGRQGRAGQS
jgi:hypothetical protein